MFTIYVQISTVTYLLDDRRFYTGNEKREEITENDTGRMSAQLSLDGKQQPQQQQQGDPAPSSLKYVGDTLKMEEKAIQQQPDDRSKGDSNNDTKKQRGSQEKRKNEHQYETDIGNKPRRNKAKQRKGRRNNNTHLRKNLGQFIERIRKKGEKPRLFLHLGVQKTGTTTVQASFRLNARLLRLDGYNYICHATYPVQLDGPNNCLGNPENSCNEHQLSFDPNLLRFRTCLQRAAENPSVDAIYSGETFISDIVGTEHNWKLIQNELKDFDVTVVLTYRRLFEWLPSYFFQMHNPVELQGDWDIVPEKLPTFPQWLHLSEEDADPIRVSLARRWGLDVARGNLHPIESEIARIRPYFPNIVIHNMHDGDFVEKFYCEILSATNTCKKHVGGDEHRNPTVTHDYAILALAARHRGMLRLSSEFVTREDVADAFKKYHKTVNESFPLTCLSPLEEEELLDRSLQFEKRILSDSWYHSEHGESEHRAKFKSYVEKSKFCNVDTDRVFLDASWQTFFNETVFYPMRRNVRKKRGVRPEFFDKHVKELDLHASTGQRYSRYLDAKAKRKAKRKQLNMKNHKNRAVG